jgi:hypothetical protein
MRPNVDFIVIGSAKAGTTTLHTLLRRHPDIFMPEEKDFKFFDQKDNFEKGLTWYSNFFRNYGGQKIVGEANSEYMFSPAAAARINTILGSKTKLIAIVRNPADRSYSEYLHQVRYKRTGESFDFFVQKALDSKEEYDDPLMRVIFGRSHYSRHLNPFVELFGKNQILLVILERLKTDPTAEINRIFRFLGASEQPEIQVVRANKAYLPKYTWLNNLILQPNIVRNAAKRIIPFFSLREIIRKGLKRWNSKKSNTPDPLSSSLREQLIQQLFPNEKDTLERILKAPIEEWSDYKEC